MASWDGIKRRLGRSRNRLIFHIGDQKTGTSTIQNAMASGKVRLERGKLLYPAAVAHNYLRAHFRAMAEGAPAPENRPGMPDLEELKTQITQARADYVVLSGEAFAEIDQRRFHDVLAKHLRPHFDEFRLIAYVRPHAARVLASFTEQCKVGLMQGVMEDFHARSLSNRRFFYTPRFQGWRDMYGDDFILRPMLKSELRNGSVLDDFLHQALGDARYSVAPMPDANVSLCLEDIVMIRLLQGKLTALGKPMRTGLGWNLGQMLALMPPRTQRTRMALHRSLAEQIRADYIEDARAMDQAFFADTPLMERELDRAVDTALDAPLPLAPEAHFTPDELRNLEMLTDLLAALLAREDMEWAQFFRARHEAEIDRLRESELAPAPAAG